ncbi:MAG: prolyl oligopeptidase family serine peptidase [Cyclobacteriaceae bacterium]|nr:prolyl oligopeptidase family serine peptidase [Cyclobacteriaceae bacterium]
MKFIYTFFIALLSLNGFGQGDFTLSQIKSYPFPNELTVASKAQKIAVAINENGKRNIYVAQAPDYVLTKLTHFDTDDGQELSSVLLSSNGDYVVFIRGGDFGSNWDDELPVNPNSDIEPTKVQIWSVPFTGGEPVSLGEGQNPVISPDSKYVLFQKDGQLWEIPVNGADKAVKLFHSKGNNGAGVYSPKGNKIAFRSNRRDHSFIGIFEKEKQIEWVSPSFDHDSNPVWSPDGSSLAFIKSSGSGGAPDSILQDYPNPWKVMHYEIASQKLQVLYTSPNTTKGNRPSTHGGFNLNYGKAFVTFLSYEDGWPHLYSVSEKGGAAKLLTPGNFMAEYVSMSPDGEYLFFSGNTGSDPHDIDRRHLVMVSVSKGEMKVLTPGDGNEWAPHAFSDGSGLVYISAGAKRPPLPAVYDFKSGKSRLLGENLIPADFPEKKLVTPEQITFKAPDGTVIHATMFKGEIKKKSEKPAIIYIHGGPPRQMLLGWHYSSYYSNAYAMNQYLASQGFVVIAVNYRLGIGYGYEFHRPTDGGTRGASEYQDIKAAGEWLAAQPYVDSKRIGVYGGSYGGYLTAMALARDSELFATGVDIHGVHDRTINRMDYVLRPNQYERAPDAEKAAEVAWLSSPVAYMDTWKSPVLIIHGDDDRNVPFSQSTDLVQRLRKQRVEIETLVIVGDTHHFLTHKNQMKVNEAIAEYLIRKLVGR